MLAFRAVTSVTRAPDDSASRGELLRSGRGSDAVLRVRTADGDVLVERAVHSVLLGLRCHYFWTWLGPGWAPSAGAAGGPLTLALTLPPALVDTDGPWAAGDVHALLRWVYCEGGSAWSDAWRAESAGVRTSPAALRAWLRLQRLARFFCFDALALALEQFLGGVCLDALVRAADARGGDLAAVAESVQLLVAASDADSEGRRGLARRLAAWIPSLLASVVVAADRALLRALWPAAAWTRGAGACGGLVCPKCFSGTGSALDAEQAALGAGDAAADWIMCRRPGVPALDGIIGPVSASHMSALAVETLDSSRVAALPLPGILPVFEFDAAAHASAHLYVGRCEMCARVDPVHAVFIEPLSDAHAA